MSADLASLQRQTTGTAAAVRWHVNRFLTRNLRLLDLCGARLTVFDAFGAPGDTLLAAIVCRHVKQHYPRLRLNLLTPNPELVAHDPHIDEINQPESYVCFWQWYLDHVIHKESSVNILEPAFRHLCIPKPEYRARVFLTDEEKEAGRRILGGAGELPLLAFNTLSKEPVKNWPLESWLSLLEKLRGQFELIHLGDGREPVVPGARRFAGKLGMRESMAVLAHAALHVGPDSFLMHAANGLDVRSVIIFGGSRPAESLGYPANINLFVKMPCGPCWIHESRGEHCVHNLECMARISAGEVYDAILSLARAPGDSASR